MAQVIFCSLNQCATFLKAWGVKFEVVLRLFDYFDYFGYIILSVWGFMF
jgi:hypothetical protein